MYFLARFMDICTYTYDQCPKTRTIEKIVFRDFSKNID